MRGQAPRAEGGFFFVYSELGGADRAGEPYFRIRVPRIARGSNPNVAVCGVEMVAVRVRVSCCVRF